VVGRVWVLDGSTRSSSVSGRVRAGVVQRDVECGVRN
jgi:hypothetical protein